MSHAFVSESPLQSHSKLMLTYSAKWRIPLGDSGILAFFLDLLKSHILKYNLKIHVLRLIGNSCADTGKTNPLHSTNIANEYR